MLTMLAPCWTLPWLLILITSSEIIRSFHFSHNFIKTQQIFEGADLFFLMIKIFRSKDFQKFFTGHAAHTLPSLSHPNPISLSAHSHFRLGPACSFQFAYFSLSTRTVLPTSKESWAKSLFGHFFFHLGLLVIAVYCLGKFRAVNKCEYVSEWRVSVATELG